MRGKLRLAPVVCLLLALTALPAQAARKKTSAPIAESGEVSEKQADLKELRDKIDSLRKDISSAEGSKTEVADQLRDAEREISRLQRELHELGDQKGELKGTLRTLGQQAQALESQLAAQQAQLEQLLYHQYLRGSPDALKLLVNGDDPNQLARDLYYLGTVARARGDMLAQLDITLKKKQALAAKTREQAAALAAIEEKQKERHGKLLGQREQKKQTLSKISAQIAAQKKEVGALQRDEKRMKQLIDHLTWLIAARAAKAREAERERARERAREHARTPRETAPRRGSAAEIENSQLPQAAPAGSFARQKGRLRLPVRGTVTNRFGAPRQEGNNWKGLFIRSATGNEVKAIAGGRVVFAEWLRGFGNLLIVDHGDAYLSIYGNNDALLKNVGDAVRAGDTIAMVGNSGGNPESGLYFEIRHQGQPEDPLKWASLK